MTEALFVCNVSDNDLGPAEVVITVGGDLTIGGSPVLNPSHTRRLRLARTFKGLDGSVVEVFSLRQSGYYLRRVTHGATRWWDLENDYGTGGDS